MQRMRNLVVGLLLIAAPAAFGGQPGTTDTAGSIPDRVAATVAGRQAPDWVSSELAVRDGGLQRGLFDPDELTILEIQLESARTARSSYLQAPPEQRPADPCAYVVTSDHRIPPPERTLEGLAASSTGIYLGTVAAERAGLLRGMPSALLRIEVDAALKHEFPGPGPKILLVAYPDAKVEIGDLCLAARSPRSPERPEVGQQILIFTSAKVPVSAQTILTPADEEVFFALPDGRASLPTHFGKLLTPSGAPLSLAFVVQQTKKAIGTGSGGA